ncbi:hypothetical protein Acr_02g0007650 [Actinidia rufa]|uniref:Uncharacterized protein n=1 Tax=Actinidia rufa TaxID=165716 RepID=A0A7J0E828_9ERIC|nr:hypothetical protein Acr_02g0007650 [Actinidia rufa]
MTTTLWSVMNFLAESKERESVGVLSVNDSDGSDRISTRIRLGLFDEVAVDGVHWRRRWWEVLGASLRRTLGPLSDQSGIEGREKMR